MTSPISSATVFRQSSNKKNPTSPKEKTSCPNLTAEAKEKPKDKSGLSLKVSHKGGVNSTEDSQSVSSSSSAQKENPSQEGGDDDSNNSLGVRITLDQVVKPPQALHTSIGNDEAAYDPLRASWPGAVAYAGSFMAARVTQFALTTASNPQGAALAFASVAGLLHLGIEPVVGALRERMGMRSDEDTTNYTNYVTSLANYVHSWARGDAQGMQDARGVARKILASYNWNCGDADSPMPDTWDEAVTMLKAGARGFASNEMPFFVFSVVYMLTNPAGLWVRSALLEATGNNQAAVAGELLMSVAGGMIAGIGTVGVQNAARTALQATDDSPARQNIKLDRLNRSHLEFSYGSLQLLKKAVKDSLNAPEPATGAADIQAIEDAVAKALKEAHDSPKARPGLTVAIATQLEQLPLAERGRLLDEVKIRLAKAKQPYNMGQVIGEKYLQMVGTRDKDGVLHADTGKIRRLIARGCGNVEGLLVYSVALTHAMSTIAQYGPANEPPHVNASLPHDPAAFPTTPAQAYGEVTSLGLSLILCWIGGRALAPLTELTSSPLTGLASRLGSAVGAAATNATHWLRNYFAAAPVTNGPPTGAAPPPSDVDYV